MTTDDENEYEERFKIFPFPDDETFVCGSCFAYRNYVHITGGYNFKDLMERKYRPIPAGFDPLNGQHIVLKYKNGKLKHRIEDLSFSRLIGGSCSFEPDTGTAYCFGGIHEEVGFDSDLNTFFVSNLLVTHRFRDKMTPIRTFVTPIGVIHPSARVFHCSAYDYDRNSIWVYGGGTVAMQSVKNKKNNRFCDLWEYQTQTQMWIQHNIQGKPLLERWGRAMTYFDNKLFVYGGTDKISQKSFWQLDLSDTDNLKWKTYHIPDRLKSLPMGCSMQLVLHPTLGPKILIIGGSNDEIYTSLGFSVDLNVEQSPKSLFPLHMISFDPLRYTFNKVQLSSDIPNVSFHGTALSGKNLFLIGGLNHCNEGRAFCKSIIILDIFYHLDKTYENQYSIPFDYPIVDPVLDDEDEDDNKNESSASSNLKFPELIKMIEDERMKVLDHPRLKFFNDLFEKHSNHPFSPNEFTLIRDQYCSNVILRQRIGIDLPNFNQIPYKYSKDFVYYLYTGSLHWDSGYYDLRSFLAFLTFCWKLKFVRLMLLEICAHIENFTPSDILKISALSLDGSSPLVDEPQFGIVKYILFHVLEEISAHSTDIIPADFDPSRLFLISHYFIPLLGNDAHFPQIELPPFPCSTVFSDLNIVDADEAVHCENCTLNIDLTLFQFDPEVIEQTKHEVVIAVSKLSLKPILVCVDDLFSAFKLVNSIQTKLSKSMLLELISDSAQQIDILLLHEKRLKELLVGFLPSIRHFVLLEQFIIFIGCGCTAFMLDRKGRQLKFNQEYSKLYQSFAWIQLDISFKMLNLLYFIIYTEIHPDDIQFEYDKEKLARALLAVCGDHPFLLPNNVQTNCLMFIKKMLIDEKRVLTNNFIAKNFIRLFTLNFIDDVVSKTNIEEWIDLVETQVIQRSSKEISKWYLTTVQSLKSKKTK